MTKTKREYHRRTDEERIAELQARIDSLQQKVELKKRQDSPVLKQIPRLKRGLLKFAQLALDHGREDLSNSTRAFVAGLDRAAAEEGAPKRRGRPPKNA